MIEDLFPNLPEDLSGPAPAFKPYKLRLEKAKAFTAINAIGLISLTIGIYGLVIA